MNDRAIGCSAIGSTDVRADPEATVKADSGEGRTEVRCGIEALKLAGGKHRVGVSTERGLAACCGEHQRLCLHVCVCVCV